jgi:hypothetical protein
VAGSCECGYEPSGSIKCGEFLDYLRTGYLLREDSAPWSSFFSYLVIHGFERLTARVYPRVPKLFSFQQNFLLIAFNYFRLCIVPTELGKSHWTRGCSYHSVSVSESIFSPLNFSGYYIYQGDRGSTVVKVLRYKSEDRCMDPRWCHGIFIDINPSVRTMALGSTQPLTEMSISWW